ncbi:MAG: hypothetical protein PHW34_08455 [Hespellia sp.]|nr:hypothetical protein [Hespellia sp.]
MESGSYQYGYDRLGRLNEVVKDGNVLRTYDYDAFGNRTSLMEASQTTTYHYNSVNQLLSKTDTNMKETYTYDKRGNLSQILANGQIKNQYVYGALNRLEQAVNGAGEAAKYQYNGLGHRVGKSVGHAGFQEMTENLNPMRQLQSQTILPENQIQYTIDLTKEYHNLLQKQENDGKQTYLWDGNVAAVIGDDGNRSDCYFQDELGSPLRLIDENGVLKDSYGYDEFGMDLYQNQGGTQPFGFTGYQMDNESGTYFAQAREYRVEIGQFGGVDILKGNLLSPVTQNLYNYVLNQPLRYIDPTGCSEECPNMSNKKIHYKWEEYCKHIRESTADPTNWALWSIDGVFSGIEVYNKISKHIPSFKVNANNKNLINISDSINYHGGRGGVRRISKGTLLTRDDQLGAAYRTNQNLNRISKSLLVINAGVSFISEYKSNPQLSVKEKVVNSSVEAAWSVGSAVAIGAAVGSIVPGAGTVAGAAIGLVVGTVASVLVDGIARAKWFENGSKSAMDYAKQAANWSVDKIGEGLRSLGNAFPRRTELEFG